MLLDWLKEAHEELNKPQAPNLAQLLSEYYASRSTGAWSRKAKIGNLKEFNEICNYLMQNKLTTPEELQERVSALSERIDTLKSSMRGKSERMKELDELLRMVQLYTEGKPVADKLATIKWKGKREQFMSENENALRLYHMAERKLKPYFKDGKLPITVWRKERDRLEQEYKTEQAELSPIHAEVKKLWQIKYKVEQVIHAQEKRRRAAQRNIKSSIKEDFKMELNWKEDNNLVRKIAKILLGDTLPNGEPVSSLVLIDAASRAELQRWADMSDAEFEAARQNGDTIHIDVDDEIKRITEE